MNMRILLRRWAGSLLGLVDEYWAMRRPWHYGNRDPQCELNCDGQQCRPGR